MRSSGVVEQAVAMGLWIPQPNNALEQKHDSFLLVPLRIGLKGVELDYGRLVFAPERTVHERVPIQH